MVFLRFLADYRHPVLDQVFLAASWIAQEELVVILLCWLYWCHNQRLAYTLGFTYFFSGLSIQALKITFRIPRPWILDPDFQPVPSALSGATGYSFPSGHTQSAAALFSTLGFASSSRKAKALFFFFIGLVGFSRMYLGVHTPKDVLVSLGISLLISALVFYLGSSHLMEPQKAKGLSLLLAVLSVCMLVYVWIQNFRGAISSEMASDAFKAGGAGAGFALGYYIERTRIHFVLPTKLRANVLRFTAGILSVGLLMVLMKQTLERTWPGEILSYLILTFWITAGYPAVFSKFAKKPTS